MTLMIAGLILFIGAHSIPTIPSLRAGLAGRLGTNGYRGIFTILSLAGFALIAWGFHNYRAAGYIPVWDPPRWTRHITITLMWFAFVALAATYAPPGRIKGWLRHPMINAVKIWATAHLVANGDLGSIVLFGAILAWGSWDRISLKLRKDIGAPRRPDFTRGDLIALGAGTFAWGVMIAIHPFVIGVSVFG